MIGLGIWKGEVNTTILSGSATVEIYDNNGEYGFNVEVEGMKKLPKFSVYDIKEGKNTLSGKATIKFMGTVNAEICVRFLEEDPDRFEGTITVPMLGAVPIENGRRVG